MSELAGYQSHHYISTDGSVYNELLKATDVKPGGTKNDMVDRTKYGQGDRQKRRSVALKDNSVTIKMDYDPTDTRATEIIAAADNGTDLYFQELYDGTNGWKAKGLISDYSLSPPLNGKQELTATWLPNADKTAVP